MNEEEKLKKFLDITLEAAKSDGMKSVEAYEEVLSRNYEDYVKTADRKASLSLTHSADKLKRDMNSETAKRQIEIRRDYNSYQNELKDKLFADVTARLIEFKGTSGYKDYIKKCIEKAVSFCEGAPMTIYVTESDSDFIPFINDVLKEASLKDVEVEISGDDYIGGVCIAIPSRNVLIDESFSSKLSDKKHKFVF